VRHFVKRGDEVHIASLVNAPIEGATVHPFWRPTGTKLDYFANMGRVKELIKVLQPEILHAHYATSYGFLGGLTNYHPYIVSTWGMDVLGFPETSSLHRRLLIWNLSKADAVCATSRQLGKATDSYLHNESKSIITPFGADLSVFKPFEHDKKDSLTIGIVKSLEPKYGIEYLIRAFARVKKIKPNLKLLIVGSGSLRDELQKLAANLGISGQTRFAGRVPHDEVPNCLHQIDIFVNPSIHESETFGVAVLEASACELPVITSDIGGLPEVVQEGITGFLILPRDVEGLAEKLELLIQNADLRQKMGKAGREFVKKSYDWNENAKIMENLYDSLIKK